MRCPSKSTLRARFAQKTRGRAAEKPYFTFIERDRTQTARTSLMRPHRGYTSAAAAIIRSHHAPRGQDGRLVPAGLLARGYYRSPLAFPAHSLECISGQLRGGSPLTVAGAAVALDSQVSTTFPFHQISNSFQSEGSGTVTREVVPSSVRIVKLASRLGRIRALMLLNNMSAGVALIAHLSPILALARSLPHVY